MKVAKWIGNECAGSYTQISAMATPISAKKFSYSWRAALLSVALWFPSPMFAHPSPDNEQAGYRLERGGQYPLCTDVRDALARSEFRETLACGAERMPSCEKCKAPAWTSLPITEHLSFLRELIVSYRRGSKNAKDYDSEKQWQKREPEYREMIGKGNSSIGWARMDLDADGVQEVVARFADHACLPQEHTEGVATFPMTLILDTLSPFQVNDSKSDWLHLASHDVMIYDGRPRLI